MVKIRLRRTGVRKQPSYRVVVADARAARNGAFIEIIGLYNPLTDPATVVKDNEKALAWLKKGAQPTDTVARLLRKVGVVEGLKPSPVWKSSPAKAEATPAEQPQPETEEKK